MLFLFCVIALILEYNTSCFNIIYTCIVFANSNNILTFRIYYFTYINLHHLFSCRLSPISVMYYVSLAMSNGNHSTLCQRDTQVGIVIYQWQAIINLFYNDTVFRFIYYILQFVRNYDLFISATFIHTSNTAYVVLHITHNCFTLCLTPYTQIHFTITLHICISMLKFLSYVRYFCQLLRTYSTYINHYCRSFLLGVTDCVFCYHYLFSGTKTGIVSHLNISLFIVIFVLSNYCTRFNIFFDYIYLTYYFVQIYLLFL